MPEEAQKAESQTSKDSVAGVLGREAGQEQDNAAKEPDNTDRHQPAAQSTPQQAVRPEQHGAQAAAQQQQQQWQAGLYYQDAAGNTQGPYDMAAMRSFNQQWPLLFPPSMMLWHTDGRRHSSMVPLAWCLAGRLPEPDPPLAAKHSAAEGNGASEAASTSYSAYAEAVLAGGPCTTAA